MCDDECVSVSSGYSSVAQVYAKLGGGYEGLRDRMAIKEVFNIPSTVGYKEPTAFYNHNH